MQVKQDPSHFIVDELYNLEELKERKGNFGNYSYFVLKKTNLTTIQAILSIASRLKISSKRFHYCGIKDKVAITTQLISLQNSTKEFAQLILEKVSNSKDIELIYIGQFNSRLNLSDNLGNKFTITITELTQQHIESIKSQKSEFDVLNYFQTQRFGICQNTHRIGLLLIQNNIKDALFEILQSLPSKHILELEEYVQKIKQLYTEYDELLVEDLSKKFKELLECLPQFLKGYSSCIEHLIYYPRDVSGAFRTIPKKIRTLYVHAFQSAIFNELLLQKSKKILDLETIYLVGFDMNNKDNLYKEVKKILLRLGLEFEDLYLKHMPELLLQKTLRKTYSRVKQFNYIKLNNSSVKISFELDKGAYATQVIDEVLKLNSIITF